MFRLKIPWFFQCSMLMVPMPGFFLMMPDHSEVTGNHGEHKNQKCDTAVESKHASEDQ